MPANPQTFEQLFEGERRRLFRALCVLTGNRFEAEELAQDAFVRAWERWDRVGAMDDPVGYLYRTAMNGFRGRYRRTLLTVRKPFVPPERRDDLSLIDDRDEIVRRLQGLTRGQRAAVVLLDMLDFSSEEAAAILATSPGAVRTQASRARAALRRSGGDRDE